MPYYTKDQMIQFAGKLFFKGFFWGAVAGAGIAFFGIWLGLAL
jgi:small basic protein